MSRSSGAMRSRQSSGRSSTKPYERNAEPKPIPRGNSDAQWSHDLFDPLSSLYKPMPADWRPKDGSMWSKDSRGPPSVPRASASYQPFGSLASGAISAATQHPQQPQQPTRQQVEQVQSKNMSLAQRVEVASLMDRMGLGGSAGKTAAAKPPPRPRSQPERPAPSSTPHQRAASSRMYSDNSMEVDMEPPTPQQPSGAEGIHVTVANLADGTTAEDVKTALSSFGPIIDSSIISRHAGLLTAEVIFEAEEHAQKAVDQLHGALADGQTLQVRIVPRKPAKQRESPATGSRRQKSQADGQSHLMSRLGVPSSAPPRQAPASSSRTQQQQPPQQPQADLFPTESRMHSDAILQLDPRASVQVEPKMHRTASREANGRQGRGRGKAARGRSSENGRSARGPQQGSSLASRLGMSM